MLDDEGQDPTRLAPAEAACPGCGHANRTRRRFCGVCGRALPTRCPTCHAPAEPDDRFCGACGGALLQPGPPEPGAPEPPDAPADPASSEPPATLTSGERRPLTVLFYDLVGSTGLASRLDPEDYRDLVARSIARAEAVIARYGGYVAQHLGDGLLVYFGWPQAWEDGPARAVRAGLALLEAASGANDDATVAIRVGVHTGTVVVSDLGAGARRETLAVGETPNVAARVQAMAEPNTLVMSAATQALVTGLFVIEDCGAHALRGLSEPMRLYRVLQPSGVRSRLDLAAGKLTPFVGRHAEVEKLLEAWERVGEGSGQVIVVTGEAGIGKSRLVYSLRERLRDLPHTWLEASCSPYLQGTAFQPVVELLERGLFFQPSDTPGDRLQRIEHTLRRLGVRDGEAGALVARLLGLPAPAEAAVQGMSPELTRRRTLDVLVDWAVQLAALQPLIVVIEDLHWSDPSSIELLGLLLEQSATAAMLVIVTARPEFSPPWPARSNLAALTLTRITTRQARALIDTMRPGLPPALVELLLARADGVPLHLEELVRMVDESGLLRAHGDRWELTGALDALAIPATLHDSLLARLDRLSSARVVSQRAAVLGREFDYGLLAGVADVPEPDLRQGLSRLVEADLLYVRGEPPSARYTFKHALIQEAAYGSLLRRTRQELHGRVVDLLVTRASEYHAAGPEVVARHAEAAGRTEQAVAYYERAAEQAQRRSAYAESIAHLRRALALVHAVQAGDGRDVLEGRLQLLLGDCLQMTAGYAHDDTRDAYARAGALLEASGDRVRIGWAQNGLAICCYTRGEVARGHVLAARAFATADAASDDLGAISALASLTFVEWTLGTLRSALARYEYGCTRWDVRDQRRLSVSGGDDLASIMSLAGPILWTLGHPDQAVRRARDAVVRARHLEDPATLAIALSFEVLVHLLRRDLEAQRTVSAGAVEVSERAGLPFWGGVARIFAGSARISQGDPDALREVIDGLVLAGETGSRAAEPMFLALLAEAQHRAGRFDDAASTVAMALAAAADTGQLFWDADLHRLDGELVLARGGPSAEAEARFHRALEIATGQEARAFALRAATSLARMASARGERAAARALLEPVYAWFDEGHDTGDLVAARALLGAWY